MRACVRACVRVRARVCQSPAHPPLNHRWLPPSPCVDDQERERRFFKTKKTGSFPPLAVVVMTRRLSRTQSHPSRIPPRPAAHLSALNQISRLYQVSLSLSLSFLSLSLSLSLPLSLSLSHEHHRTPKSSSTAPKGDPEERPKKGPEERPKGDPEERPRAGAAAPAGNLTQQQHCSSLVAVPVLLCETVSARTETGTAALVRSVCTH